MKISLIVATTLNGVIGKAGRMPWHLPADLQYFKQKTSGHCILMGRKTFEAIGRVLPNRTHLIISKDANLQITNAYTLYSVSEGIQKAAELGEQELFVIGGGQIYAQTLAQATCVYRTLIHIHTEGDTFFPDLLPTEWQLTAEEYHQPDAKNPFAYTFQTWERGGKT